MFKAALERMSWFAVAILTTGNQVCMKFLSAETKDFEFGLTWISRAFHSPWLAGIIFCEVTSLVLWMRILSTTDVSRAVPLTALAYVLILAVSRFIFHEPVVTLQMVGMALILAGVWLVGGHESQPSIKET